MIGQAGSKKVTEILRIQSLIPGFITGHWLVFSGRFENDRKKKEKKAQVKEEQKEKVKEEHKEQPKDGMPKVSCLNDQII